MDHIRLRERGGGRGGNGGGGGIMGSFPAGPPPRRPSSAPGPGGVAPDLAFRPGRLGHAGEERSRRGWDGWSWMYACALMGGGGRGANS